MCRINLLLCWFFLSKIWVRFEYRNGFSNWNINGQIIFFCQIKMITFIILAYQLLLLDASWVIFQRNIEKHLCPWRNKMAIQLHPRFCLVNCVKMNLWDSETGWKKQNFLQMKRLGPNLIHVSVLFSQILFDFVVPTRYNFDLDKILHELLQ